MVILEKIELKTLRMGYKKSSRYDQLPFSLKQTTNQPINQKPIP